MELESPLGMYQNEKKSHSGKHLGAFWADLLVFLGRLVCYCGPLLHKMLCGPGCVQKEGGGQA